MIDGYKDIDNTKVILVTGSAGFIGYHLSKRLLEEEVKVVGYDNINDYYDIRLKHHRLELLKPYYKSFIFIQGDLADKVKLKEVFEEYKPNIVVNLAAQAGVRYSIENPDEYIKSNVVGFLNVLECCKHFSVEHLVYASSSSVYGNVRKFNKSESLDDNKEIAFNVDDRVDKPVSLYAATKKSNELMAYTYSHLYGIPSTGLRFFTVYGPLGRPDMAYYSFTKDIIEEKVIKVFNNGNLYRDFTYIDDIIDGIMRILNNPPKEDETGVRYKIYNIGNSKPEKLMDFIEVIERNVGKEAKKEYCDMQKGDVYMTYADVSEMERDFEFRPRIKIEEGLRGFVEWYRKWD